jgi:hypothetical protein
MYHLSTYLHSSPLLFNLPVYRLNLPLIEWVTKMRPGSNLVEDHPQVTHNEYPVHGALVGASLLWPSYSRGDCITLLKTSNLERVKAQHDKRKVSKASSCNYIFPSKVLSGCTENFNPRQLWHMLCTILEVPLGSFPSTFNHDHVPKLFMSLA